MTAATSPPLSLDESVYVGFAAKEVAVARSKRADGASVDERDQADTLSVPGPNDGWYTMFALNPRGVCAKP